MRRALALWLLLLAAYAATLPVDRGGHGEVLTAAEAHRLLTAQSIAEDRGVSLDDEYRDRSWREFTDRELRPTATPYLGRTVEPQGIGFATLVAPAYAAARRTGVKLLCAALSALAFVLAGALGRRLVPGPWATRAAVVGGLSPPALAHGAAVEPFLPGAALLCGALLLALRVREAPQDWRSVFGCAVLVALAPWVSLHLAVPAVVIALALARWLRRRRRGLSGFVALEVVLVSAVVFITIDDRLVGGPLPTHARSGDGPLLGSADIVDRLVRLPRVLLDPDAGLLRWAPAAVLAGCAVWLLWRSVRDRVAQVAHDRVDVEVTCAVLGLTALAGLVCAAFVAPRLRGEWLLPPDVLVVLPVLAALAAWGAQRFVRTAAVTAAATLALSALLVVQGFSSL